MQCDVESSTIYFKTYEQREDAFRKELAFIIPRRYLGPAVYWNDLGQILDLMPSFSDTAFITGNPADCLAFGTPYQVLLAAFSRSKLKDVDTDLRQLAEMFDIAGNLFQPVSTLSGGETVKLALAKAYILADYSQKLLISSPFTWLAQDSRDYFITLFNYYKERNLCVKIFALDGENSDLEIEKDILYDNDYRPLDFTVRLKDASALFDSLNFTGKRFRVFFDDIETSFSSPCIVTGPNGTGKSLLAKVLAKAVTISGSTCIVSSLKEGRARLLFQDVISQTMFRSIKSCYGFNISGKSSRTLSFFKQMADYYTYFYRQLSPDRDIESLSLENPSMLTIKIMLTAARLAFLPAAIILDEPDWGLSKTDGAAFVFSVIKLAHQKGVPVIIISHKTWWNKIGKSRILVQRSKIGQDRHGKFFKISLNKE